MTAPDLAAARLAALLVAECENTALRVEVAHLRVMVDGLETAAHEERAAVVAWLREQREYGTDALLGQGFANVCNILSTEIERGEHRRKEKE